MFSFDLLLTYTLACLIVIISPGPDNILAIGRGLSQGRFAALVTSAAAALGLMVHVCAASFGLALIIQTSQLAFMAVKVIGAGYLIWLGFKALRARDLVSFEASEVLSLRSVFWTGFLTNVLNPKPAVFILAFIPQFIQVGEGAITFQMLLLGSWFAALAFLVFASLGCLATRVSHWFKSRPRAVVGLNIGAGFTLIAAGLSIVTMEQK
ncbi:LysE family translocator [Planktotalea sp.]|uniref:LysE family translocator n=1 Tax=Planktotalea sp. TaxID=2029877 RepID=UPI003D6B1691